MKDHDKETPRIALDLLPALGTLVHVVEGKSFSAAARVLGRTPSAVSRSMSNLEDRLQVQLFVRSRKNISPTPIGHKVYESCKEMHNAARKTFEICSSSETDPSGNVNIAGPVTFMRTVVHPVAQDFLAEHPSIKLKVIAQDKGYDDPKYANDLLFLISKNAKSAKNVIAQKKLNYFLCASLNYFEVNGVVAEPSDLLNHNCMHFGETESDFYWTFRYDREVIEVKIKSEYVINNSDALLDAARKGTGIALLPDFVAEPALEGGNLVRVLDQYMLEWSHSGMLLLVNGFNHKLPKRVEILQEYLIEALQMRKR